MAEQPPKKAPRKLHYLWAIVVLIVSQGFAVYWGFSGFTRFIDDLIEVEGPGTETIDLPKAGIYTIFYEDVGEEQGDGLIRFLDPPPMVASLSSVETEQELELRELNGSFTYVSGLRGGIEVYDVEVTQPGAYIFTTDIPPQFRGLSLDFRFAHNLDSHFLWTTVWSLGIAGLGWISAVIIVVVIAVKRRKAKKSSQA